MYDFIDVDVYKILIFHMIEFFQNIFEYSTLDQLDV